MKIFHQLFGLGCSKKRTNEATDHAEGPFPALKLPSTYLHYKSFCENVNGQENVSCIKSPLFLLDFLTATQKEGHDVLYREGNMVLVHQMGIIIPSGVCKGACFN